jgi:hypothetical protein
MIKNELSSKEITVDRTKKRPCRREKISAACNRNSADVWKHRFGNSLKCDISEMNKI